MELDQFKKEFNQLSQYHQQVPVQSLEKLLHQKPFNVVQQLKRNLTIELILAVLLIIVALLGMLFSTTVLLTGLTAIVAIIGWLFFIIGWQLYIKVNRLLQYNNDIKWHITQLIVIFEKFTAQYFIISMVMLPLLLLTGLALNIYLLPASLQNLNYILHQRGFIGYTILSALWSVIMYFFSKWYLQKLYGQYLQQLKVIQKDLNEQES